MATMIEEQEPERPRPSTLLWFLGLSILVHVALLLWLRGATLSVGDFEPPPLVVKLAQAPAQPPPPPPQAPTAKAQAPSNALPANQIVAPSDKENQLPPDGRAFLSDRDNRVDQETIKKGNPEAGAPQQPQPPPPQPPEQVASAPPPQAPPAPKPPPQEPAAKAPPAKAPPAKAPPAKAPPAKAQAKAPAKQPPKPAARRAEPTTETARGDTIPERLPGLNQLFAPPDEVLARAEMDRRASGSADSGRSREVDDPRKDLVSAPPPAPGLFGGARGSFDYLPDVAQGNLTMLNTKADRFAPFVRRVGTRVFQNLLIYQRQNLEASDIMAADDIVTARVILDASGKLKNLEVDDHSGSMAVDQTLIDALRQAAFDDNPPKSAANANGEFEFVFQAQLIAGVGPGPRGPELRSVESRLRIGLL